MALGPQIYADFSRVVSLYGVPIRVVNNYVSGGAGDYDDAGVYTVTGSFVGSAILSTVTGGDGVERALVDKGFINVGDFALYIPSGAGFAIDEKADVFVNAGSYVVKRLDNYNVEGSFIYTRAYLEQRRHDGN